MALKNARNFRISETTADTFHYKRSVVPFQFAFYVALLYTHARNYIPDIDMTVDGYHATSDI